MLGAFSPATPHLSNMIENCHRQFSTFSLIFYLLSFIFFLCQPFAMQSVATAYKAVVRAAHGHPCFRKDPREPSAEGGFPGLCCNSLPPRGRWVQKLYRIFGAYPPCRIQPCRIRCFRCACFFETRHKKRRSKLLPAVLNILFIYFLSGLLGDGQLFTSTTLSPPEISTIFSTGIPGQGLT